MVIGIYLSLQLIFLSQLLIEKIINAKSAKLINGDWILEDLFSRDFIESEINEFKSKIWKESPSDKDMKRLLSPKYLSILELRSVLKEEKLEFKLNSLELEFWRKVFHPYHYYLTDIFRSFLYFWKSQRRYLR